MKTIRISTIFQDIEVRIGKHTYESSHMTRASAKRLHAVMKTVIDTLVDFDNDFTPTVTLFFAEKQSAAIEEQSEPEWHEPGYIGDGFTNEYDYDHPVHGNTLQFELDSEYDMWLDSLHAEPETCDCGRALHEHGEPHPDCQCCAFCGTFPCICSTPEPEDEPEDDERTQWVDNHEDDWKI